MIKTFRCGETEKLRQGHRIKRFQAFEQVARRKLRMLDAATKLMDLKSPGNQLEALQDDRTRSQVREDAISRSLPGHMSPLRQ